MSYFNLRQRRQAAGYVEKAYVLRDRVSEWERRRITNFYYRMVTGEIDRMIETLNLHKQTDPCDFASYAGLSSAYKRIGQYEESVAASLSAANRIARRRRQRSGRLPDRIGTIQEAFNVLLGRAAMGGGVGGRLEQCVQTT